MGDIISNFKIENPERPNKGIVYPFALLFLLVFGYLNYRIQVFSSNIRAQCFYLKIYLNN